MRVDVGDWRLEKKWGKRKGITAPSSDILVHTSYV